MFVLIMFEIKKRDWENNKKLKSLFSFYAPNSNVCVLNYSVSFIDLQIFFLFVFWMFIKISPLDKVQCVAISVMYN